MKATFMLALICFVALSEVMGCSNSNDCKSISHCMVKGSLHCVCRSGVCKHVHRHRRQVVEDELACKVKEDCKKYDTCKNLADAYCGCENNRCTAIGLDWS